MRRFCMSGQGGAACDVIDYDGNTDTMREVETGKLDATLEDNPIASFYARRFPSLQPLGEPVGKGYYVIYVNKGSRPCCEPSMRRSSSWPATEKWSASIAGMASGTMPGGLAEDRRNRKFLRVLAGQPGGCQERHAVCADAESPAPSTRLEVVRGYSGVLLQSAGMTVVLSLLSFPVAILLGLLVAIGRLYGPAWLKPPLTAYVEFLRGTPLMLQLYFIFFFLPEVGIVVPAFWTAILGLAINYSAYRGAKSTARAFRQSPAARWRRRFHSACPAQLRCAGSSCRKRSAS